MKFEIIESKKIAGATIELDAYALEPLRGVLNYCLWTSNNDLRELRLKLDQLKMEYRI